jgi:phosphomannomutase
VGALLADFTLSRFTGTSAPLVLASVVSSPLVAEIARQHGACFERTHTGFKWLWHAALELEAAGKGAFCFAYEEALGYSVFSAVRDKDGIAAGRALAELAAECAGRGQTLFDRLRELYERHGLWASAARNVALRGAGSQTRSDAILNELAGSSALELCGQSVVRRLDYRELVPPRPSFRGRAALLELELADGSLVFVRPSGTEPKLKLYGHVRRVITPQDDLSATLTAARTRASRLLEELEKNLPS